MANLLFEIGLLIIAATAGGYVARLLRQPVIPAYILMGVLLGPVFHVIGDAENMFVLSEIGVAFLLFIVGMELDLRKLRDVGAVAVLGGGAQAAAMFVLGFLAAVLLGMGKLTATYMGLVMAFSSTMVVIKMLSDKAELESLHGRIIIGILLLQDILAILALSALQSAGSVSTLAVELLVGVALIAVVFVLGRILFPPLFRTAAKSLDLLFLVAVSVCLLFSLLFAHFGFSIAIGAFVAGVILGNLPYHVEIISRVRPLKDFFSVLFFTSIGLQVSLNGLASTVLPFVVFFLLTVVVSPFLTMMAVSLFGHKKRTGFLTGLNLSQVSEFALILAVAGYAAGHLSESAFSLVLELTIATIFASAYLIKYDEQVYARLKRFLPAFERLSRRNNELEHLNEARQHDVLLVGYDRTGYSILDKLRRMRRDVVVVDLNPDVIKHLIKERVPCVYGDVGDPEVLEKLRLHHVTLVISTIPNFQETMQLLKRLKTEHSHAKVIVTSHHAEDALDLYDAGADYVVIPHYLGGHHVSVMLEDISLNLESLIDTKLSHIRELRERRSIHGQHR